MFARSLAYGLPPEAEALEAYAGRLSKHLQHTFYACENALQQTYEPDLLLISGVGGEQARMLAKGLQEATESHGCRDVYSHRCDLYLALGL